LYTGSYPVYTFVYNAYRNPLTPLFVKVDIVDMDVYNVDISAPNSGGDVSNTSQVRSTYCAVVLAWIKGELWDLPFEVRGCEKEKAEPSHKLSLF
jgi:hypothetical protein